MAAFRIFFGNPQAGGAAIVYQYSRPDADSTDGMWLNELGTNTNLYASIDEATVNDSDYIHTESASACIVSLGSVTDPGTSDNHIIKFRAEGNGVDTLRVSLLQDTTVIATRDYPKLSPVLTTYQIVLFDTEADSISDYTNLNIKLETIGA